MGACSDLLCRDKCFQPDAVETAEEVSWPSPNDAGQQDVNTTRPISSQNAFLDSTSRLSVTLPCARHSVICTVHEVKSLTNSIRNGEMTFHRTMTFIRFNILLQNTEPQFTVVSCHRFDKGKYFQEN